MLQTINWNSYLSLESSGRMTSDPRRGKRNPAFCFLAWLSTDFLWSSVLPCSPSSDTEVGAWFSGSCLFSVSTQGHLPLPGASVLLSRQWEAWSCTDRSCLSASSGGWLFPVASDVAEVLLELNPLHLEQGLNHKQWSVCCPLDCGSVPKQKILEGKKF